MDEQRNRAHESLKERDMDLRIMQKLQKRDARTNDVCSVIMDQILEIANEAYIHQQKKDSDAIEDTNWREWLQLFTKELPVDANNIVFEHQFDDHDEKFESTTEETIKASKFLNEKELDDYLTNQGQWKTAVVTENKPNLEEILNAPDPNAAAAKGKGAPEKVQLEEGEDVIPDELPMNHFLGDAIQTVIKLNNDERPSLKEPKVPNHLPLKLCVMGRGFSGKSTQAEKLASDYGLRVYQMNQLIEEALNVAEQNDVEEVMPIEEL